MTYWLTHGDAYEVAGNNWEPFADIAAAQSAIGDSGYALILSLPAGEHPSLREINYTEVALVYDSGGGWREPNQDAENFAQLWSNI